MTPIPTPEEHVRAICGTRTGEPADWREELVRARDAAVRAAAVEEPRIKAAIRLAEAAEAYREASVELSGRLAPQTRRSRRVGFTEEWYQGPARNIDRAIAAYRAARQP